MLVLADPYGQRVSPDKTVKYLAHAHASGESSILERFFSCALGWPRPRAPATAATVKTWNQSVQTGDKQADPHYPDNKHLIP
jgi:hypothetical protein